MIGNPSIESSFPEALFDVLPSVDSLSINISPSRHFPINVSSIVVTACDRWQLRDLRVPVLDGTFEVLLPKLSCQRLLSTLHIVFHPSFVVGPPALSDLRDCLSVRRSAGVTPLSLLALELESQPRDLTPPTAQSNPSDLLEGVDSGGLRELVEELKVLHTPRLPIDNLK